MCPFGFSLWTIATSLASHLIFLFVQVHAWLKMVRFSLGFLHAYAYSYSLGFLSLLSDWKIGDGWARGTKIIFYVIFSKISQILGRAGMNI